MSDNKALTLEQLREMDGEPVWFDTIKRWGIVKVCRDGVFVLTKSGEFEVGGGVNTTAARRRERPMPEHVLFLRYGGENNGAD